jgi:prefoldin subunit 5
VSSQFGFLSQHWPFNGNSPDTTHIFVNVGFGFHAELTLDEALQFIKKKEAHLQK